MNSSRRLDSLSEAITKNFISFALGLIINCINGAFVHTFFKNEVFQRDPRYVLYIHLVINDMIMLTVSVMLQILTYTTILSFAPCCLMLLISVTTNMNTPLNLAGMAVERYIAICRPLHHTQICTVQRACVLIALIWSVSLIPGLSDIIILVITSPLVIISRNIICSTPNVFNTPYHTIQSQIVQVLLFFFVFLVVIITYLKVFYASRTASGSDQASNRNASNTILLHGIQIVICMMSFISPLINITLLSVWPHERTTILFISFQFTNVLPRLLSPLIYGVRDKKFSSHMRKTISCKCCSSVHKRVLTLSLKTGVV